MIACRKESWESPRHSNNVKIHTEANLINTLESLFTTIEQF